jgi:hypothetical protein
MAGAPEEWADAGIVQNVAAGFVSEGRNPSRFSVTVYRKPAYSRRDATDALADAFRGDAKYPHALGPSVRFPAGPLGGALECKTLYTLAAACNWADGEIIGTLMARTQDLDALAALTLEIRAAIQP